MITEKINDNFYWFQCPRCKIRGHIDREQAEGKVSILCDCCGYHETKNYLEEYKIIYG